MPVYDRQCRACGTVQWDSFEKIADDAPTPCPCGEGERWRVLIPGQRRSVSPDDIPGGLLVHHGICWPDGTPRRFYSRSEMRRVARDMGQQSMVRHTPLTLEGDKNPHTSRWVSPPVITEEARVAHIRALYAAEGIDLDNLPARVDTLPNATGSGDRVEAIIANQVREHITLDGLPYGQSPYAGLPDFKRR